MIPIRSDTSSSKETQDLIEYSVTISTSSRPLSSFSGAFIMTLHSHDHPPSVYDFKYGRFPRASIVRYTIAYPRCRLPISAVSIQTASCPIPWRIKSINLLPLQSRSCELTSSTQYTVPVMGAPPVLSPLLSIPRHIHNPIQTAGSAILYIWIPAWTLAAQQRTPTPRSSANTSRNSSISSTSTLVPSSNDIRGWSIDQVMKLSSEPPSSPIKPANSPTPSKSLAPVISSASRYGFMGHVSLSLSPTSSNLTEQSRYISFWPNPPSIKYIPKTISRLRKLYCSAEWSPSLEEDIRRTNNRRPNLAIHLNGVDAERAARWVEEVKAEERRYAAFGWNCVEVVWEALLAGLEENTVDRDRVKMWEFESTVRSLVDQRPEKKAERLMGHIRTWLGTKVPADLEIMVDRMRVEGYLKEESRISRI